MPERRPTEVVRTYWGAYAIVEWLFPDSSRPFPLPLVITPWYALSRIVQWWVERGPLRDRKAYP